MRERDRGRGRGKARNALLYISCCSASHKNTENTRAHAHTRTHTHTHSNTPSHRVVRVCVPQTAIKGTRSREGTAPNNDHIDEAWQQNKKTALHGRTADERGLSCRTCSMISSSFERRIAAMSSEMSLVILRTRLKTMIWKERGEEVGEAMRQELETR